MTSAQNLALALPRARDGAGRTTELAEYLDRQYRALPRRGPTGWSRRFLFVGEAPPVNGGRPLDPRSPSGAHLERLLGRPLFEVGAAINLFGRPMNPWSAESAARRARQIAKALVRWGETAPVPVLLGRRVTRAFGLRVLGRVPALGHLGTRPVLVLPHPSPRSRWWNPPRVAEVERVLREVVR